MIHLILTTRRIEWTSRSIDTIYKGMFIGKELPTDSPEYFNNRVVAEMRRMRQTDRYQDGLEAKSKITI